MSRENRARRTFLGRAAQAGLGFMLMHGTPAWAFGGVRHRKAYRERSFFTMGSVATVCAYGESIAHLDDAINKVIAEFARLDTMMSVFNPASDITRLNAAAGLGPVRVSAEVSEILEFSGRFNAETAGLFDVTVEPLMNLWGFRGRTRRVEPTDREIAAVLETVGMHNLTVHPGQREASLGREGARVDLGGIGVGYAVDRAVQILRSSGVESAFINHAGDAYALGVPDEQDGWIAAIPHPVESGSIVREVTLVDRAISTSANAERFTSIGKMRYGHIMNVRSGRPDMVAASMTVVAPSAIQADAVSTAAFCRPEILANVSEVSYFTVELDGDGEPKVGKERP